MKKLALAMAAAAALLFTAPVLTGTTTPAEAQTVVKKKVVIKHGDRRHHGWERGRHRGWAHSNHRAGTKVVIKRGGDHHANRTVIKKKTIVR